MTHNKEASIFWREKDVKTVKEIIEEYTTPASCDTPRKVIYHG